MSEQKKIEQLEQTIDTYRSLLVNLLVYFREVNPEEGYKLTYDLINALSEPDGDIKPGQLTP